jgi:hypothetical protein
LGLADCSVVGQMYFARRIVFSAALAIRSDDDGTNRCAQLQSEIESMAL